MAALLAAAAPQAHAAVNQFVMGMVASGSAPFDGASGPGKDTSSTDAVVRTSDQFVYRVGYSLTQADTDIVITVSMGATSTPIGYTGPPLTAQQLAHFSAVDLPSGPNGCANITTTPVAWPPMGAVNQSGVSSDGQHIVCYQPGALGGANMDFIAWVGGAAPNGTTIAPPIVTFQSAGITQAQGGSPTVLNSGSLHGAPTLTVSAAPRWKVAKKGVFNWFVPGSGPGGEDGFVLTYNVGVYAEGSRKGLEALQPNFTIADNYLDSDAPNARLMNWDYVATGMNLPMGWGAEPGEQNGCGDWRGQLGFGNGFDNFLRSVLDWGDGAVPSGTETLSVGRGGTCMASVVNNALKTATLNLANTDFSLTHFPTYAGVGGVEIVDVNNQEAPTNQWWVASKSVLVWVPASDLTPDVWTKISNQATLGGAVSVTGQINPVSSSTGDVWTYKTTVGSLYKTYSCATRVGGYAGSDFDSMQKADCDPNITGNNVVNRTAPGQLLLSWLTVLSNTQDFTNGYVCDKIDNSRLALADMRTSSVGRPGLDPATGISVTNYGEGTTPYQGAYTIQLGVGGTGTTGGTWTTRSNSLNENLNPSVGSGDQALATCGDADATWYGSIQALLTAGHTLAEVTRVRIKYSTFPKATGVWITIPLTVNDKYAYTATETGGTTPVIVAGQSTLNSIAPNQALLVPSASGSPVPVPSSDGVLIGDNEYVMIQKSALAPNNINGGQVPRGAYVDYRLQVNLTSSTSAHTASSVTVWDVLPAWVDYVPGSSTFGGAALADPVCENPGVTPSSGPFAANSVSPGFRACQWVLLNQPVAKAAQGAAAGNLPVLGFQVAVRLDAPAGTSLLNTSYADSPNNQLRKAQYTASATGFNCNGGTCSFGNWTLNVSGATGVVLNKAASAPQVIPGTGFSYALNYAGVGADLSNVRLLDILPYQGDGRGTTFAGTLRLTGPIATPVAAAGPPAYAADPALVVLYTVNTPSNIKSNPYDAGQILTGVGSNNANTTVWCTVAQFGTSSCPGDATQATAFMALPRRNAGGTMPNGVRYQLQVPVTTTGNQPTNAYFNNFVLDSPDLAAHNPGSNTVRTTVTDVGVPNQAITGRVYREGNGNTTDDGNAIDPGMPGVTVQLTCTNPAYNDTTTTAADGTFSFTKAVSGANCTLTETQPANYGNAYNLRGTGGTADTGGTGTGSVNSTITLTVPYGGSSGNVFAEGGLPGQVITGRVYREDNGNTTDDGNAIDPGLPGVTVQLTCTNPAYNGTSTTAADGTFSFTGVTSWANCTLTETQPADYDNAYNIRGTGGTADTGGAGTGAVDSTITLTVPPEGGSTGNLFAEKTRTVAPVHIPTLGWPGLSLLGLLLGAAFSWRRKAAA